MVTEKQRRRFIKANLARASHRMKPRSITIDVDYLYALGEMQHWKCKLTGIPLEFTRGGGYHGGKWINPNSCSIDRIDSTKDYHVGNVQLVCAAANDIKSCYDMDEFVSYATLMIDTYNTRTPVQLSLPMAGPTLATVLSARGAASAIGKSRTFIMNAIKKGKLPAMRRRNRFDINSEDLFDLA